MSLSKTSGGVAVNSGPTVVQMVTSLLGSGAQILSAGAMLYLAYKISQQGNEDNQKERRASLLLDRQVSAEEAPHLGKNAFELSDQPGGRAHSVAFQKDGDIITVIKDSPEAVASMKNVFNRLCRNSSQLLSASDVEQVHNLLGEPMDDSEREKMMVFFGAESMDVCAISFERFMSWWGQLHDSSADPDHYYSQERYRQRFKVLQSRLKCPQISRIQTQEEGEVTSRRYRVNFMSDGAQLSPWHDIPLKNSDGSYNFICEIPKWTRKKFEICTGEPMNPIKQDVKNGVLREYKWGDMMFNYGAFPQTWEDPKHVSPETGCPGDNDPIDVIELGTRQRPVGSITSVKIVGVIAMIDSDETDWKILAVANDDDKAKHINDLADLDAHMPGATAAITHWLRMYKTADGKPENKFGCGGKPQNAKFATKIVQECHESWRQLIAESAKEGKMKKVASGSDLFTDLTV